MRVRVGAGGRAHACAKSEDNKQFLTRASLAVTYRSTSRAQRSLTSQIERDGVLFPWYEGTM